MLNNIVLLVSVLTILFGTLFPIVADALQLGKYSVGPPYFNAVFLPLMLVLIAFMAVAPWLSWKASRQFDARKTLLLPATVSLLVGLLFPAAYAGQFNWKVTLGVCFGSWLLLLTVADVINKARLRRRGLAGMGRLSRSYWGMILGHLGFAVATFGVTLTSQFSAERDVSLAQGQEVVVGEYAFTLQQVEAVSGPNYQADRGRVTVVRAGEAVATLYPEKRRYGSSDQVMTEAGIDGTLTRDLYVSLGEQLVDDHWAVRVQVKPFVRWLWLGGLMVACGGVLAITDPRYRRTVLARSPHAARATAPAPVGVS